MNKGGSSMRARPGGGFNQGLGQFGEHLDESSLQQAVGQKALGQQQADPAMAKAAAQAQKNKGKSAAQKGQAGQKKPQPLGSIPDELIKQPARDIWSEVKAFFSLHTWLGINPDTTDPEEKAKLTQIHQRYQQLDQEQQQVAKRKYQEELQKKQLEQEEEEQKKQAEAQQKQQAAITPPSSPKKGPIGPASGKSSKKSATQLLQQQRQMLSQGGGAN